MTKLTAKVENLVDEMDLKEMLRANANLQFEIRNKLDKDLITVFMESVTGDYYNITKTMLEFIPVSSSRKYVFLAESLMAVYPSVISFDQEAAKEILNLVHYIHVSKSDFE